MTTGEYGQTDGAGRLLAGRYRITAQLGRGGMGVVWRAVDEVLGREVAVKELRTYTDADAPELAGLRLRMQREARAAARVRHPGVVAVHDIAEVDGRPLIVMELVDGPSLDDVLRRSGTLDPREAAGIGAKVTDALAAAHAAGVLHRDVKPGNILLDRSGRVVLTDFGIATMDDPGDGSATHLTRSGEIVGSLDYLAPERAQGAHPGPASDVWALGATLYAAVEGASPFRRTSTFSTLTAIVGEPLPEPRLAGPLAPVLRRLMDKRPDARPDAAEARELLEAVAAGSPDAPTSPLRGGPVTPARQETERSLPAVPPGFGPVQPTAPGPGGVEPGALGSGAVGPTAPVLGAAAHPAPGAPDFGHAGHPAPGAPDFGHAGHPAPGAPDFGHAGHPAAGVPGVDPAAHPASGAPVFAPGSHPAPAYGPAAHPPHPYGPTAGPASAPTAVTPAPPRRKGRVLLAALAVTAVLAAAGVTVALVSDGDDPAPRAGSRPEASPASLGASASDAGTGTARSGSPSPKATATGDGRQPGASRTPEAGTHEPGPTAARETTAAPSRSAAAGGTGGTTGGGGTATRQAPAPAPACHAIGGGKYNCQVWRTATSYTALGSQAGVLNAGTNYFYCQQNLGRRESYGEWTNVWWAKTDDDSGNSGVWVSDVYVKGGNNDEPVPGLPVC
ncbi:serine/threonine-protein kinase [Streptomyces griseosporeus]|uniref:serine/threonine-protein kinase n=1 Tax=Streptomyces griseosporeus TaxID=1910 RepID=UPI0036F57254